MHILLINTNPVVSRLFVLCAGEVDIELEEVSTVDAIKDKQYAMVFVDESAYETDVLDFFQHTQNIKRVFISYANETIEGFDFTIKKPFLPSFIIEFFKENIEKNITKAKEDLVDTTEDADSILDAPKEIPTEEIHRESDRESPKVLDNDEIEKIKTILESSEEDEVEDLLSEEDIEKRKVELIKKQLVDEGVEIVEENEIVDALSTNKKTVKKRSGKNRPSKIILAEEEMKNIENILQKGLRKKQMRRLLQGKKIKVFMKLKGDS